MKTTKKDFTVAFIVGAAILVNILVWIFITP